MYVVGLNGPPRVGKDTVASLLQECIEAEGNSVPITMAPMSQPLRHMAFGMVGTRYNETSYESFKRTHFSRLSMTGRELMISCSEDYLKPCFGESVLAQLWLEKYSRYEGLLLIPDSGFQCEVDPIIQEVGESNFSIVNIIRPEHTFAQDSREWIKHPNPQRQFTLHNESTIENLKAQVERLYKRLVNQCSWMLA